MLSYCNKRNAQLAEGLWLVTSYNLLKPAILHSPLFIFKFCNFLHFVSLFFLLSYFFGWIDECHIGCFLLEIRNLHMSSFCTLVPEELWVLYITRYQIYWGLTHNVVFYQYSDLISHTHKLTYNTHQGQETNSTI